MAAVMLLMCGCSDGDSSELSIYVPESFAESEIDYTDDAEFEAALNRGEYLVGKVVRFKVNEIHPDSYYGFNLWAGKHLNFIFPGRVEVDPGDEVTVKVSTVFRHDNDTYDSWIINSTKVYKSGIERSDYTRELSIDNVNFCVPKECSEENGKNTIKYYYYPDGDFIMTMYEEMDYKVSIHDDLAVTGLRNSLEKDAEDFKCRKEFVNDIPVARFSLKRKINGDYAYIDTVYLNSDKYVVSFGIGSKNSAEEAKSKCDDLISTIRMDNTGYDPGTDVRSRIDDDPSSAEPKEPEKSFEQFTVSGRGSKVIRDISLPPVVCVVHYEHSGRSNFIVHYYSESGNKSSLSNEIGSLNSYQVFDARRNGSTDGGMLEVNADGSWSVTFIPLVDYVSSDTKTFFTGKGDSVVGCFIANGVTVCKGTHTGDSNFIVHVYEYSETGDRLTSAFNEIGIYTGETVLRTKAGKMYFFNVMADGNWTLDLS